MWTPSLATDIKRIRSWFLGCVYDFVVCFGFRYIGIGFRQRQSAFDLRAALVDQIRRNQRLTNAGGVGESNVEGSDLDGPKDGPVQPNLDLSLKEGEKIKVKINIPPGGRRSTKPKKPATAPLSLRPPDKVQPGLQPVAGAQASGNSGSSSAAAQGGAVAVAEDDVDDDDDDWGDFQS